MIHKEEIDSPDPEQYVTETDYGVDELEDEYQARDSIMESFKMLKNTFEQNEPVYNQIVNSDEEPQGNMDLEELLLQSESLRRIQESQDNDKESKNPFEKNNESKNPFETNDPFEANNEFSSSDVYNYESTPVESDPQKEFDTKTFSNENINKVYHETSNEGKDILNNTQELRKELEETNDADPVKESNTD